MIFISFEGGEGSGKTTQIQLLIDYLTARDLPVAAMRDPGGTPIAEKIRTVLKDKKNNALTARAEALLYFASRSQMVETLVRPHLDEGTIVICDRFTDSTTVYQGHANGLNLDELEFIGNFATGGLIPNLTFLLEIEPEAGLARKAAQGKLDRMEAKGLEFHRRVAAGYAHLAKSNPGRIITIDAGLPVNEIHEIVVAHVEEVLDTQTN
ncbi:MAG: dTMP kinase [Clostridiales bacterium]|jgi:dTMP kinase|nr:dTMP kinase [Clostridiales bacterium]